MTTSQTRKLSSVAKCCRTLISGAALAALAVACVGCATSRDRYLYDAKVARVGSFRFDSADAKQGSVVAELAVVITAPGGSTPRQASSRWTRKLDEWIARISRPALRFSNARRVTRYAARSSATTLATAPENVPTPLGANSSSTSSPTESTEDCCPGVARLG